MTWVTLAVLILLAMTAHAGAATITVGPSDCSSSAVNGAIASAADGDTVSLTCTGSVTWSSTVTIPNTKGVALVVAGATNTPKTSAKFPLTVISGQTPAVAVNVGTSHAVARLSGFKFQQPSNVTAGDTGFINVNGGGTGTNGVGGFRVDNNYLDNISGNAIITVFSRNNVPLYGLIDNNTMMNAYRATNQDIGPYGIQVWNYDKSGECWGGSGWNHPFAFGDANNVFIEDNLFENTSVSPRRYMRHHISSELGGRFVARYNEFNVTVTSPSGYQTDLIEAHGLCLCSSNGCGGRGGEVYGNKFNGNQMGRPIMMRGGHWLIYDNVFNAIGSWGTPIWFMEYRAGDSGMYGQCSSSCPCTSDWVPRVSDGSRYPLPQQLSKTYVWNNLFNGVNQTPGVDSRGVQELYIQANRDYFVSTAKPGALAYTRFAYPHPLRGTSASTPPAAPTNLEVR
jgi:hypothetical protein